MAQQAAPGAMNTERSPNQSPALEAGNMATNKAKRSINLTQSQPGQGDLESDLCAFNPRPTELMPVKARIYHAIADLNDGFEKTIHDLKQLQNTNFFHSERLATMHDLISKLRAQANRELLNVLSGRETSNTAHFEQLCRQPNFQKA